ncbi:hypothetical protein [Streptomyces sp. NPDC005281]|uniref:hypothetical protein n=1 Tax=Streptomyces sp. NPDC005281 TaxID=3155712 RepID=UPI0033A89801
MHESNSSRVATAITAEPRSSLVAAGLYAATAAYDEALRMPNPAAALDNMYAALDEIAPSLAMVINTKHAADFAEALRDAVDAPLQAYRAIEHSRIEAGDGYGYLFGLLADSVRGGTNPAVARKTALDAPGRIRELAEAAEQADAMAEQAGGRL